MESEYKRPCRPLGASLVEMPQFLRQRNGYATLRTSRTAATFSTLDGGKPVSWTRVAIAATALVALVITAAVLALYFTNTVPFSSSNPSPASSSTGVGAPEYVFASDVVIPSTGSFTWHVNTIGSFVAGDVATLTCTSAPGLVVTGVIVDADASTDTILLYVWPGGLEGTLPSHPVSPWLFTAGLGKRDAPPPSHAPSP